ncbi:MAG: HD domain-containing protein [Planctomycetota bacterium]|nr:MAG: HD domain-containing protein [Planctomycetota bacterium]
MPKLSLIRELICKADKCSLEEHLTEVGLTVNTLLKADTALFYLLDQEQDNLILVHSVGKKTSLEEEKRFELDEGIAGWVVQNESPIQFPDIGTNPDWFEQMGSDNGKPEALEITDDVGSVLAVPLMAFGNIIGTMEVLRSEPGRLEDKLVARLAPLVNLAALAIPLRATDESFAKLAEICVRFLEEKDQYTHGHSLRVMRYSMLLADELELQGKEKDELRICALLHDIGKVIIKDSILSKTGKLTYMEFNTIKMHPRIGSNITGKISKKFAIKILSHHERWDGNGYPQGLCGNDIPLIARIIAVADTLDAITTDRPYRERSKLDKAVEEIERHKGTQFDPVLVDALARLHGEGRLNIAPV